MGWFKRKEKKSPKLIFKDLSLYDRISNKLCNTIEIVRSDEINGGLACLFGLKWPSRGLSRDRARP